MLKRMLIGAVSLVIGIIAMIIVKANNLAPTIRPSPTTYAIVNSNTATNNVHEFIINQTNTFHSSDILSINTDVDYSNIHISNTTNSNITVHVYGNFYGVNKSDLNFSTHVDNNVLNIELKHKASNSPSIHSQGISIDILLPKKIYNKISLKYSTGNIALSHINVGTTLIDGFTGSISMDNSKTILYAHTKTGTIKINNLDGPMTLETNVGNIQVKQGELLSSIFAQANVGTITISTSSPPKRLKFNLSSIVGTVSVTLPDSYVDKQKKGIIQGSIGDGGPNIKAVVNTGSIILS